MKNQRKMKITKKKPEKKIPKKMKLKRNKI